MKKFLMLALSATVFTNAFCQQGDNAQQNYVNIYKELAISEELRTGVPASIILAQGILETESGQCDLVKRSNNHFGIKCKSDWQGATVYHDDDEKGECFRSYNTAEDSYKDHSDFLKNRPNYAFLFKLDPTDYEGWAKGLKKAGYATSPVYAANLIKVIVANHLQDYTLMAIQRQQAGDNQPLLAFTNVTPTEEQTPEEPEAKAVMVKAAQSVFEAPKALYPEGAFTINETKVVYAEAGASLFALASKYKIAYPKLLEFNELKDNDILDKNQLIFLAKKQKKGATAFHIVNHNETLQDIAQIEGVRLESITEYNHVTKNDQPIVGEKIYLQDAAPASPKLLATNM